MSAWDSVRYAAARDLDGYELEPLEREVARGFTLRRTVVVLRGGGEEGRGEEVDYDPAEHELFQARRNELPVRRPAHARVVLAPPGRPDRLPALGVRVGSARSRAAPGGPVARRGARPEGRSRSASSSRRASRTCRRGSRCLPTFASSSTPTRSGPTRRSTSSRRADASRPLDFKGVYRGDFGDAARPGALPRASPRRSPPRGSRTRPERRDDRGARRRIATGSRGTRRSTSGATSRRCRSRRAA